MHTLILSWALPAAPTTWRRISLPAQRCSEATAASATLCLSPVWCWQPDFSGRFRSFMVGTAPFPWLLAPAACRPRAMQCHAIANVGVSVCISLPEQCNAMTMLTIELAMSSIGSIHVLVSPWLCAMPMHEHEDSRKKLPSCAWLPTSCTLISYSKS